MNATSRDEFRGGPSTRESIDEKMDQIKELLLGDEIRRSEAQFARLELKIKDVERALAQRLDALQARIDAMSGEIAAERRASFDELSRSVASLSTEISRIGRD